MIFHKMFKLFFFYEKYCYNIIYLTPIIKMVSALPIENENYLTYIKRLIINSKYF